MGSVLGGGKGEPDMPESSQIASRIAQDMYYSTEPIRQTIINRGRDFLRGRGPTGAPGFSITHAPAYRVVRPNIEDQYQVARENLISNVPSGGALTQALGDLESNRAQSLQQLMGNIAMDEYNKIFGLATGTAPSSATTLATIGGQQAQAQMGAESNKVNAMGDLGLGIGMLLI
jgi:hypothetical protein